MIPFSKPDINHKDLKRVVNTIKSGWLAHGKNSEKLENLFLNFTKSKFCTTVSNCTTGIHAVCMAIGLNADHEVIVPAQTHVATAHAAAMTGAKIKFADVNDLTGNIMFSEIKKLTTKKTKCIIVVHMAGYSCEMNRIVKFCKKKNIFLIEDCAHGLGTIYKKKHVGNFGIAGVFSFYPTKQITTGEGGILITNKKDLIKKVRVLKALGVNTPPELRKKQGIYDVTNLGLNYRLTDFQAALAIGQILRYKKNINSRHENAKKFISIFSNLSKVKFQKFERNHSYFVFQIFLNSKKLRDNIMNVFKKKNIGCSIHYATPVPLMSYYRKKYNYKRGDFPNAEKYGSTSISLPVHQSINEKMIKSIYKILNKFHD